MLLRRLFSPIDNDSLEDMCEGTMENTLSSDFANCFFECCSSLFVPSGVGLDDVSR